MIETRENLKSVIAMERKFYISDSVQAKLEQLLTRDLKRSIWLFQKHLRYSEYYYNNRKKPWNALLYIYHRRRKNVLGERLGIYIWENTFDEGLHIFYTHGTVINGKAKVGKNCRLHGNICIGNNGRTFDAPVIGDNADLGVGTKIIGGIELVDNITTGAGAVVVNSFNRGGVLVGVPARYTRKDKI